MSLRSDASILARRPSHLPSAENVEVDVKHGLSPTLVAVENKPESVLDEPFAFGDSVQIGLGGGFLAIYVIGMLYERRTQWWPLVPGGFLVVTGLPEGAPLFAWMAFNWPLIFVVIGALILFGALRSPRPSRGGSQGGE